MIRMLRELLGGGEEGYTLIELIVVMAILGTVVAGLTTVFVSGSAAELDLNLRFQAQQQGRLHSASFAATCTAPRLRRRRRSAPIRA